MFRLQSVFVTAAIGLCIIIQPSQSFFRQSTSNVRSLGPLNQFDSRQDVVVKAWSRKDGDSSEAPKDQSVRKLLDMLNSRSISSRQAKKSFESILSNWRDFHLSEIGWHRLLDGAIRWRYPTYAISSFEIMTEQGIVCPAYLMTSLLQLVCISGLQDTALSLFDAGVAAGLEPSVHCFSPLLKSCGTAQKARELLQRMEFVGIQANVISYTAAIKSCESTGDWRSALELLDLMRASGITANEITYCCAINVASRGNAGDVAVNILREMLSLGFPPNLLCYGSALTGCAKVGMWHEVEILLDEMEAFGIPLQESVVISVLNVCRGQSTSPTPPKISVESSSSSEYDSPLKGVDPGPIIPTTPIIPIIPVPLPVPVNDMRSKVMTCQWARALWLIENYGPKATNVTESMYTMAMDVCESNSRYREVVDTYHMMMTHKVQPSKSSFSFALRACAAIKDGEQAVRVIRGAQLSGSATPFMFNSTLVLLDSMKRSDMAVKVLRDILTIGVGTLSGSLSPSPEEEDTQGQSYFNNNRMRLPPAWLTRRIISAALQNLTENFAVYFTEVKNGRLSPSRVIRPFVNDVAEVLKGTVQDRNLYLNPSAYPMANKILLDNGDFETLQLLLNHTLYKPEVNTTRLYDFALKSLLKDNPSLQNINVVLSFIGDVVKASIPNYAASLMVDSMERLVTSRIRIPPLMSDNPIYSGSVSRYDDVVKGSVPKRGSDINEIMRANLLFYLFEEGRKLFPGGLPQRAYTIVALACKKANLSSLMLTVYRYAQEDKADDKMLRNIIIFTLARSADHWDIAIEILEDMRKMNLGVPDLYMYHSALTACDSGKDWEQAIYLLNRMQEDGHNVTTISVTSVITACAVCGQYEEALRLLQMMEDKGIARTVWTYNAAISACAKGGNWKAALSIFEKMRVNSMIEVQDPSDGVSLQDINTVNSDSNQELGVNFGRLGGGNEGDENNQEEQEEDEDDEDEEEKEEEGWDESQNADFDVSFGTGDYQLNIDSTEGVEEGVEEVGLFHAMRGVANQVTYNTLIEALGEGGQIVLVDELYREAIQNGIVSPLINFSKGWIDLHGHSVHMAKAAIRYTFEHLLTLKSSYSDDDRAENYVTPDLLQSEFIDKGDNIASSSSVIDRSEKSYTKNRSTPVKKRELAVIVGKGAKLVTVIQQLLMGDFHPSIRSYISKTNSGRLLLSESDISNWLSMHKSLR